jgi:class 3 adenylate cyclase
MNYLQKYKIFEANVENDDIKRSERLLTQAQREFKSEEPIDSNQNSPCMLFTDVEGSSKMWADDPISMMKQLEYHHKLIESISEKKNGWIVKTIGDAFMVYFESGPESLTNALNCAKEIILSENKYNLRVGICKGFMQEKTYRIQKVDLRDFYGNAVNVAARMESKVAEEPGIIAFSSISQISENKLEQYDRTIGKIQPVDLSKYELRGAKIDKAYRIKIK